MSAKKALKRLLKHPQTNKDDYQHYVGILEQLTDHPDIEYYLQHQLQSERPLKLKQLLADIRAEVMLINAFGRD